MLGVIKGSCNQDYITGIKGIMKEAKTPLVLFEEDKGLYSFKEALSLLIAIKNDNTFPAMKEWFRLLKPMERKDIERAWQDYRRVLDIAINA
jgi:hypothetical protein